MRKVLILIILCLPFLSYSQQKYYIRTDSLVVEKINGAAELLLRNSTRDTLNGMLVNIGQGRTRFIRAKVLNDSTLTIGTDTLVLRGGVGGPGGGTTDLDKTLAATTVTVTSNTGTDAVLPSATHSLAGVMSAADKRRLDSNFYMRNGIAPGDSVMVVVNDSTVLFKRLIAGNNMSFTVTGNAIQINGPSAGTTETANEGLIKTATNIQLGNTDGSTTSQFSTDRTVPLGGRTLTFLSGRISIRSSASTIPPLLLRNDGGANGYIYEVDRTGHTISNDLFTNWKMISAHYPNVQPAEPDSINDNYVITQGYNLTNTGARADLTKPQFVLQSEQNFIIGGYGRSLEWLSSTINRAGQTIRPWYFIRSWDRPLSAWDWTATNYQWKNDSTGTAVMSLNANGILDLFSSNVGDFPGFRAANLAGSADPTVLFQHNAAGSGYLPLIGAATDSTVFIGSATKFAMAGNYTTEGSGIKGYYLGAASGKRGGLIADHDIGYIKLHSLNASYPLLFDFVGTEYMKINTSGVQLSQLTGTGEGMPVLTATGLINRINGTAGQVPTKQADGTIIFATPSGGGTITTSAEFTGDGSGGSPLTLAVSGVTAGSYTNANITVDSKGRITVASNGSASGTGWDIAGNTLSATGIFGTLSNHAIDFKTNNVSRGGITADGKFLFNVPVGTEDATSNMQLDGNILIGGTSLGQFGIDLNNTVAASANSQTLYGLRVRPGYSAGAFTGVGYNIGDFTASAPNDMTFTIFNTHASNDAVLQVLGANGGFTFNSTGRVSQSVGVDFTIGSSTAFRVFGGNYAQNYLHLDNNGLGVGYNASAAARLDVNGGARFTASAYLNWATTTGSGGYGIRDNAGVMEFKDDGDAWTPFSSAGGGFTPAYATYLLVADKTFSAATTAEVIPLDTEETESGITHTGSSEEITFPNAGIYNISSDISAFSSSVDVVKWAIQKWDGDSWELVANSGSLVSIPATSMTFGGTQTFQITMGAGEKIRFISTATSTSATLNAIAAADGAAAIPAFRVRINKIAPAP